MGMPDLFTHMLAVYILYKPISWYISWFSDRYLGVMMIGGIIPDLSKIRQLGLTDPINQLLGQELILNGIHRLGPTAALAGIGAMLFQRGERWRAFGWLMAGSGLHFVLDLTVKRAGGVAPPYLYPLTWWEPPTLNILLSSNAWPMVLTSVLTIIVWGVDQRLTSL